MNLCNAFTVDVEDYFQVSAFEDDVDRDRWSEYESRVVDSTRRILQLLDDHQVQATFFVLGWIAQRYPDLLREIQGCGHEIGSHSYWHRLVYRQSPDEFRADLRDATKAIEDAIGQPIVAYRAPSFSITKRSLWALRILVEEGFRVDSSIVPARHDRYGLPGATPAPHCLETESGELWEFPISVRRIAGVNVPVAGGGYFRLYPLKWTLQCLNRMNKKLGQPFVFYIHPWELDPAQPRIPVRSRLARARHYVNLASTYDKLDELLGRFSFATLTAALSEYQSQTERHVVADS